MANPQALDIPEVGHAVRVRNRLATVRAVEPYESRDAQGRLHIVEVEYLDDCRFPEAEQLLWEVEATAKVLGTTSLPGLDAHPPDSPTALTAFVNARKSLGEEHVLLDKTKEGTRGGVRLATMHRVKGLEFPVMILAGGEQQGHAPATRRRRGRPDRPERTRKP